ncbi:unnamed protein product [Closterium sp. NIES-65]|nr:unnamed protein product [Closterium sp. NIES-65]
MSCWAPLARLGACAPSNGIVACLNACDGPTIDCYDSCYADSGWLPPLSTAELIAFPISACCLLGMSLVISCMMSSTLGLDMATLQVTPATGNQTPPLPPPPNPTNNPPLALPPSPPFGAGGNGWRGRAAGAAMDGVDERLRWQAAKVAALRTRGSLLLTTLLVASTSVNVSFTLFVSGGWGQVASGGTLVGSDGSQVGSGGLRSGQVGSGGFRWGHPPLHMHLTPVHCSPPLPTTLLPCSTLHPLRAAHPARRGDQLFHPSHPLPPLSTPLLPPIPCSILLFLPGVLGMVMGFVLCVLLILLFVGIAPLIHFTPLHPSLLLSTQPFPFLPGVLGMVMGFVLCVLLILLFVEIAPPAICARHSLRIASATAWLARLLLLLLSPVAYPVSLLLDRYLNNQEDEEESSLRRGLLCGTAGSAGSSPRIYITNPLANPPSLEFPDTTASALDTGSLASIIRVAPSPSVAAPTLPSLPPLSFSPRIFLTHHPSSRSGPYDSSRSKPVSGGSDSPLRRRIEQAADRAAAAAGAGPSTPAGASTGGGERGRKTESGAVGESGEEVVMALPVGESQEYTSVEVGEEGEGYSTREEESSEKVGRGGREWRGGSGRGGGEETAEESDEVPMALPTSSDDVDTESDDQRRNLGRSTRTTAEESDEVPMALPTSDDVDVDTESDDQRREETLDG